MKWLVLFDEDFDPEFNALPEDVQDELLAHASMLHLARIKKEKG